MKIKNLLVLVFVCMTCSTIYAQKAVTDSVVIANEDSCNVEAIQSAIDACLLLAEAAESNDTDALRKAREAMQACDLSNFGQLRQQNIDANESLDGHLVFNVAFADSLAKGKDAYGNANDINRDSRHRGQMAGAGKQILTKTVFVKANGKSVYTFNSRDRQELAIVAEPGGLVTTRVHAINKRAGINEWHNDTADVAKGRNSRKTAFTLPHSPSSLVTLEIMNCTGKDISVVVISN